MFVKVEVLDKSLHRFENILHREVYLSFNPRKQVNRIFTEKVNPYFSWGKFYFYIVFITENCL